MRACRSSWLAALLAVLSGGAAARAAPCEAVQERVMAYSLANDEYVIALRARGQAGSVEGIMVRRLSTDQPLEFTACDPNRRGAMEANLGLRACWFSHVRGHAPPAGLTLEREAGQGAPWRLWISEGGVRMEVLSLQAGGAASIRAADRAGNLLVVLLAETRGGACPSRRERAVVVDPAELLTTPIAREVGPPEVFHPGIELASEELRQIGDATARPGLVKVPNPVVIGAARVAAGAFLDELAECWLQQRVTTLSSEGRQSFWRGLLEDVVLGRFAVAPGGQTR